MDLHAMKELLANACRVLAFGGQRDGIWGHVTLRLPEGDRFLMKPHEMGLEEIMADDVITVTLDGQKVAGHRKIHSEVPIHAEILRARPDVNCVVHTHPAAPIVFSALGQPMLPISNEGCLFFDSLPTYTGTTDLIREPERGRELAACLGQARAALMRNHPSGAHGITQIFAPVRFEIISTATNPTVKVSRNLNLRILIYGIHSLRFCRPATLHTPQFRPLKPLHSF